MQGKRLRQIILFLFFLPYFSFFQFDRFIVQRSGIVAVYLVSQKLKKGFDIITHRKKLVFLSHFPHLDPTSERDQFRPSRKAYFPHAPYIAADNHIAAHQLIALGTGNEAYPVIEIIRVTHHAVNPVFIILLSVFGKR